MRLFFIAFQFLTIVPLPFRIRCEEEDLGRSMAFFPLVGLCLGAGLAGLDFCLAPLFPRPVADLLLVVALTVVTGALHLDGLADVCDALAARGTRERFLAVMKDSRVGPVGAVGLGLGLLLKYEALLALPAGAKGPALLLFPLLARFGQVQITVGARRAREDGLGALFSGGAGWREFLVAGLVTVAAVSLLLGARGLVAFLSVALITWLCRLWAHRRLGGITGDVIGCTSELGEITALLALLALAGKI
jgi:adenosylcobinamide-GDP ribazoletransferase